MIIVILFNIQTAHCLPVWMRFLLIVLLLLLFFTPTQKVEQKFSSSIFQLKYKLHSEKESSYMTFVHDPLTFAEVSSLYIIYKIYEDVDFP